METLNVQQAAALLHMNSKRIQNLARAGKLPAVRIGRRWLFRRDQIESLLGCAITAGPGAEPDGPRPVVAGPPAQVLELSARNRLRGWIERVRIDGLMAEVQLRIGDQELVSVITRSSLERLGLKTGDAVFAVIKSTEVMIGKGKE